MTLWPKQLALAAIFAASTHLSGGGLAAAQDAAVDAGPEDAVDETTDETTEVLNEIVAAPPATLLQRVVEQEAALAEAEEMVAPQESTGALRVRLRGHAEALDRLEEATQAQALASAGRSAINENIRRGGATKNALEEDGEVISARLAALEEIVAKIDTEMSEWATTHAELDLESTPQSIAQRIERLVAAHREVLDGASERTRALIALQENLVELEARAQGVLEGLEAAQATRRAQLLSRIAPPLWEDLSGEARTDVHEVPVEHAWSDFLERYGRELPVHLFFFVLFLVATVVLGRWARESHTNPEVVAVLGRPVAAVLVISLLTGRFLYAEAPSAIFHLLAALALAPLLRLLPVIQRDKRLRGPTLCWLGLFAVQELITFAPLSAAAHRWISLAITVGVLATLIYVLHRRLAAPGPDAGRIERAVPNVLRVMIVPLIVAIVAEILGYTNLAQMITPGLLVSFYVIWVFTAALYVAEALVVAALRSPKMEFSNAIRRHRGALEKFLGQLLHVAAVFCWVYVALSVFELEAIAEDFVGRVLSASLDVGTWSISLGGILSFGVVLWLTVTFSKVLVATLDEDVLPRIELPQGAPSTISRLTRYAIWALGFFFAVGAAGVDMSSVALLVSALGVGIGFGLQNIVNNFVSGLILIFERPIREGDMVEVGGLFATVKAIGLRASVVRTVQGAEVIVPNADMISAPVTNWTLSDPRRRVDFAIGVAYGTDVDRTIEVLTEATDGVEGIVPTPAPIVLFRGFGDSSLDFEVRFWVAQGPDWPIVESAVATRVNQLLAAAGIEIPFPQRDLHVRSIDDEAAAALLKK